MRHLICDAFCFNVGLKMALIAHNWCAKYFQRNRCCVGLWFEHWVRWVWLQSALQWFRKLVKISECCFDMILSLCVFLVKCVISVVVASVSPILDTIVKWIYYTITRILVLQSIEIFTRMLSSHIYCCCIISTSTSTYITLTK